MQIFLGGQHSFLFKINLLSNRLSFSSAVAINLIRSNLFTKTFRNNETPNSTLFY